MNPPAIFSALGQSIILCIQSQRDAAFDLQFVEDIMQMHLDCAFADVALFGDLFVAAAACDQPDQVDFARSQLIRQLLQIL